MTVNIVILILFSYSSEYSAQFSANFSLLPQYKKLFSLPAKI